MHLSQALDQRTKVVESKQAKRQNVFPLGDVTACAGVAEDVGDHGADVKCAEPARNTGASAATAVRTRTISGVSERDDRDDCECADHDKL